MTTYEHTERRRRRYAEKIEQLKAHRREIACPKARHRQQVADLATLRADIDMFSKLRDEATATLDAMRPRA